MTVLVFGISEETIVIYLHLSVLITVLQSQLDILRKALALLLCKTCHNSKKYLAFGIHCVYVLFFKEYGDILFFEKSDEFQAVKSVSSKTAD